MQKTRTVFRVRAFSIPNCLATVERMKKNLSLFIFVAFIFLLNAQDVFARGGGGGSGGGGGGGFIVGVANLPYPYNVIGTIAWITFLVWIVCRAIALRKKQVAAAKAHIAQASLVDPAWEEHHLTETVRDVFVRFQKDWSDYDAEAMKAYCVPAFHARMVLELAVLKAQKRRNLVADPVILSLVFLNAIDSADNAADTFTVELSARANDQLIDTETGRTLMVEKEAFVEYWNFLRDGDVWRLNTISQATADAAMVDVRVVEFARKNGFFYDADFGWLMMPNKGAIFAHSNFKTSDINNHVIGTFRDKIVEFYTFRPNGEGLGNTYLVAQTILPVSYVDILVRKRKFFGNFAPSGLRKIETESNDFNKKFCLYADPADQVSSFVLLAPDFMEEVYNLPFVLNIEIVGSFLYFYVEAHGTFGEDDMLRLLSRAFDSMKFGS